MVNRKRTNAKSYRKRPKYFRDQTVNKITVMSTTLDTINKQSKPVENHVLNHEEKRAKVIEVEGNLKEFIAHLDDYVIPEQGVTPSKFQNSPTAPKVLADRTNMPISPMAAKLSHKKSTQPAKSSSNSLQVPRRKR